jgi:hypothetical protein
MRSVSMRAWSAALLLLLVFFSAVPAFADDPLPDTVLQGRIHTPPGVAAEGRIHIVPGLAEEQEDELALWDFFLVWLLGRIHVPGG